jgi:hypothetical protein
MNAAGALQSVLRILPDWCSKPAIRPPSGVPRTAPSNAVIEALRHVSVWMNVGRRPEHRSALRQCKQAKENVATASQRQQAPQRELTSYCAIARNHFCRERLQHDVREGIREVRGAFHTVTAGRVVSCQPPKEGLQTSCKTFPRAGSRI